MGKPRSSFKLNTETICNKLSCITRSEHWVEGINQGRLKQVGGRMGRHLNGLRKAEK